MRWSAARAFMSFLTRLEMFPRRTQEAALRLLTFLRERWRVVAIVAGGVVLIGAAGGIWAWQQGVRENAAGQALAAVNLEFRKQYPGGFYLSGGESSGGKPDALIQRYHQVATAHAGTRAGWEAVLRAAHLEYGAGQYDAAIRNYERYAERASPALRGVALLGKGYALLAKGDAAGAAVAFGGAAAASPEDPVAPEAYLAQGRALEAGKRREEALRAYAIVTERYAQSIFATQATERTASLK